VLWWLSQGTHEHSQLFNYLIHAGTNWVSDKNQPDDEKRNKLKKDCSPTDSKVIVQNGELLAGIICKKAVCANTGRLCPCLVGTASRTTHS
jgi:hypothetical protein